MNLTDRIASFGLRIAEPLGWRAVDRGDVIAIVPAEVSAVPANLGDLSCVVTIFLLSNEGGRRLSEVATDYVARRSTWGEADIHPTSVGGLSASAYEWTDGAWRSATVFADLGTQLLVIEASCSPAALELEVGCEPFALAEMVAGCLSWRDENDVQS